MGREPHGRCSDGAKKNSEQTTIEQLTALALGSIGLSLADFEQLTPAEFTLIAESWQRDHVRPLWDAARLTACASLQPWSRKALKPQDIVRMPWDSEQKAHARQSQAPKSSKERFEELCKRAHLNY